MSLEHLIKTDEKYVKIYDTLWSTLECPLCPIRGGTGCTLYQICRGQVPARCYELYYVEDKGWDVEKIRKRLREINGGGKGD